jgi:hypothetical protein
LKGLTNRDVVVIVDGDQVAELQVSGQRSSFASNTFLSTAITKEHKSVVIDQIVARLVEDGAGVSLCNSQANGVGETLAQGTGSDFDTWSVVRLRVTGSDGVDLLVAISISAHGETKQNVHGSSSGHQWRPCNQTGGSKHIAACNRDRCCFS